MTVGYDAIQMSPDQSAFEFTGRSVRCLSENQFVDNDGTRKSTGKVDGANAEFARLFTENLPALAEQDPVFADLQNIFDLALATTLISTMDLQHLRWLEAGSIPFRQRFHNSFRGSSD
ncbi:MAG UNVERIFIED_CONTAM: hypothetical protein LVR18_50785 [Planctomycetaceae bacterium]|jgi:hypothetical protein